MKSQDKKEINYNSSDESEEIKNNLMKKRLLPSANKNGEKKNVNLIIASRIVKGGVLGELEINSKLGETKQSYYNFLDEARDYYKKKINDITEQEKISRGIEKKLRSENKSIDKIKIIKRVKKSYIEEKKILISERRREVFDLKKFIKNSDFKEYIKPRLQSIKNSDSIEFKPHNKALKGVAKTYRSNGLHYLDFYDFFEKAKAPVFKLINENLINYKVRFVLHCAMVKLPENDESELRFAYFSSAQEEILKGTNLELVYEIKKEKIHESLASYQKKGSGYILHHNEFLEVIGSKYNSLKGSSYIPTPEN